MTLDGIGSVDKSRRDDGALYALGNGHIIAYGHGVEWDQVFGTPYTSPTALTLNRLDGGAYVPPEHVIGRGTWMHRAEGTELEDTVADGIACLARRWCATQPIRWRIGGRGFKLIRNTEQFPGCSDAYLLTIPGGTPAYNWYPTHAYQYVQILLSGDCDTSLSGDAVAFTTYGTGELYVSSGADYPSCIGAMHAARKLGFDGLRLNRAASDLAFFVNRRKNAFSIDESHPLAGEVQSAADDIALLIRAQQGASGGVLAGSNYHLGYVRDQYGVARGLLAMGCFDEAKALMRFYGEVFRVSGKIRNAQGIGVPDMFHLHENDAVEITGYLVCLALDVWNATGDDALFDEMRPLIDWALREQLPQLHNDMLPFNGDETYIAGGILPRTTMCDGSMEATMLFILGAERYLAELNRRGERPAWLYAIAEAASRARAAYSRNFHREGGWVANSRMRREGLTFPEFRHGVCLRNMVDGSGFHFGWLRHLNDSWYVCPECYAKGELPEVPPVEYRMRPTLLMHTYMGSDLIEKTELRGQAAAILADYRTTGIASSLPDGNKSLGYDYGLLLYSAKALGLPADDLLKHMLSVRDSAGAWVEYYVDNQPLGTRCRPWESGMNIEAALAYLRS